MSAVRIGIAATPWDTFEVEENCAADGDTAVMTKVGLYTALKAIMPASGDVLAGWTDYFVDTCHLSKRPGGMGKLTVNLHYESSSNGSGGPFGFVSRKLALTWRQEDGGLWDGRYTTFGSDITISNIQMWRSEPNATLRAAYKFNNPVLFGSNGSYAITYTVVELAGNDLALAKRIDAGQTGHMLYMPVLSVTERYTKEPKLTPPPRIVTAAALKAAYPPPKQHKVIPTVCPGTSTAYQYMLTRSDAQQDDRGWTVTKEWLGSVPPNGKLSAAWGNGAAFDPLFYPAAASSVNDPGCV